MNDQENAPENVETVSGQLALPGQNLPDTLYVIPIHGRPFFPAQVLPVIVNEDPWSETLQRVANTEHHCLALFFVEGDGSEFDLNDLPEHGTVVRVHHASQEGGKLQFVAQGLTRVRIRGWLRRRPPYLVEVEYPQSASDPRDERHGQVH